jgi:hypothetical protein
MPAFKGEPGPVMVESNVSPGLWGVAHLAPAVLYPHIQLPLMRIRMTGPASHVRKVEARGRGHFGRANPGMAGDAGNGEMGS